MVISESANVRRGDGQGKTCGMPTTSSEARRVPAKRPVVDRDRGWRCGGIVRKCMIRIENGGGLGSVRTEGGWA
jgi:hypothetical protein